MISWIRVTLSPFNRIFPTSHTFHNPNTQILSSLHLNIHLRSVIQNYVHVLVKTLSVTKNDILSTLITPSMRSLFCESVKENDKRKCSQMHCHFEKGYALKETEDDINRLKKSFIILTRHSLSSNFVTEI